MPIKKTLIVTTMHDVTPFTDEYIEMTKDKIRLTSNFIGSTVTFEVREENVESPMDVATRLLQSVLGERKENDERPRD